LWGWIPEKRPPADFSAAGWAGSMALPRKLSLDHEGNLQMEVAKSAESLRGKAFGANGSLRGRLEEIRIEGIAGEFAWKTDSLPFALSIEDSSGPWWSLEAQPAGPSVRLQINETNLEFPAKASDLDCRLFLDASVAEFFCNRRFVLTTRIYRKPDGPLRMVMKEADVRRLHRFEAWQLQAISKDRLTT